MRKKYIKILQRMVSFVLIVIMLIMVTEPAIVALANETTVTIDKGDYVFQYNITGQWDNHINASITITNTSDKVIDNWSVKYNINGQIENIWNAVVYDQNDGEYIIKNATWNQDINVGETVSFGYTLCTQSATLPSDVEIICAESVVNSSEYKVDHNITNSWGTGCIADIYINNLGDNVIEDWILEFDYENEITSISGGIIVEHKEDHYVIKNPSYSQNINPKNNTYIQVLANLENVEAKLSNVILREIKTETIYVEENYGVELDKSQFLIDESTGYYYTNEAITEFGGKIYSPQDVKSAVIIITNAVGKMVLKREIEVEKNFAVSNAGLLIGDNIVTITVEYNDGSICTEEIIVTNYLESNMNNLDIDMSDVDGDGLNGFVEELYGSNPECIDTDGDGLSDYEDLFILGYSPASADSDNNGILDSEEDADGDGLTNLEEIMYATDNCTIDSDGDLLTDFEEIMEYNTNPVLKDSDDDGVSDDWEIKNGYDPNLKESSFIVEYNCVGEGTSVEITLEAEGQYVSSFTTNVYKRSELINSTIPGYLGDAYDFCMDGEFVKAEVKYKFDETYLELEEFEPTIYYFNEDEQILEEVDTVWDGESNYVTAELEHFSIYLLLNKTEFESGWEYEIVEENLNDANEKENINIVFVVDISWSMANEKMEMVKESLDAFVDALDDEDKAALVTFGSYATEKATLSYSRNLLKNEIAALSADFYATTAIYKGLIAAENIIAEDHIRYGEDARRDIILLYTDGMDEPATKYNTYQNIIDDCNMMDVEIYSIGVGVVDDDILSNISSETGGKYFKVEDITELVDKMNAAKEEILAKQNDANNDGIPDDVAKEMFDGNLHFCTGAFLDVINSAYFEEESIEEIELPSYTLLQENDDFDKDGLKNGDEWIVVEKDGKCSIKYKSNPFNPDTDGDGYTDGEEKKKGTNINEYTVKENALNTLFNDGIYMATLFEDEYDASYFLQFQLAGGNFLGNGKVSYVKDYKIALLEFMQIYSEGTYEKSALDYAKEIYDDYISDAIEDFVVMEATYISILKEANEYSANAKEIWNYKEQLIELKKDLEKVVDLNELMDIDTKLSKDILEQLDTYKSTLGKLSDSTKNKLNSKIVISEKWVKKNLKISEDSKMFVNKMNIGNTIAECLFTLGEATIDTNKMVDLYSKADAGIQQYEELSYFLDVIKNESLDSNLKSAVNDLRMLLTSDMESSISEIDVFFENVNEGIIDTGFSIILTKCGPIGWSMDLGLSIGDFISNTGELNEKLLYVLAIGEATLAYEYFKYDMTRSIISLEEIYYELDDSSAPMLAMYAQLRIVGEDYYAQASDSRGFITDVLAKVSGDTKKEVNSYCRENITYIYDLCNEMKITVAKKYKNSFLY